MYNTGDKVLHPLHGAGIIEGIETKKVLVKTMKFYIFNPADISLEKIYIPMNNAENIGVRYLVEEEMLNLVEDYLKDPYDLHIEEPWKSQFKKQESLVNSGNIMEVAKAFKFLFYKSLKKKLGEMDKWLFRKARDIMASEMHLVRNLTIKECTDYLTDIVNSSVSTADAA
jgi:CarD family transcriptional regulator